VADLSIEVVDARVEPYAAVPTLVWSLHVAEATGVQVHTVVLHTQVRIEPARRPYGAGERENLLDLFGRPDQWSGSLHPFLWAHLDTTVNGFVSDTVHDLAMPCSYDFEVAGAKYLHALGDGEVPLIFLFSGTVFSAGGGGFAAERVPWHLESRYRLPVARWREAMDRYFPGEGWLRLPRPTIDRLQRYRAAHALPTWDQAVESLLKAAGEDT
jgi:hypothetical protein